VKRRIFRAVFLTSAAVMLAGLVLASAVLYGCFGNVQKRQLSDALVLAAGGVETEGESYLSALKRQEVRLTWVDRDGTVLFDSESEAAKMESHALREEIRAAFLTGEGESSRFSSTLTQETLYRALRLSDGTVLRASVSRRSVFSLALGLLRGLAVMFLLVLLLSVWMAGRMAKRIVRPLNAIDLDAPLENDAYDELSPLLSRIEGQKREIRRQKEALEAREREFGAVTENMREGLVLLSGSGRVLSMNPAAAAFFQAPADCRGRDFLTLERDHEIGCALREAAESGKSELRLSRTGREYQLNASRIGEGEGLVLLIFDITERFLAEQSRREFTANVSHELKTPLQAILGSAELLENGLVRAEDAPEFVSRIRSEAKRLLTLIEDILRLSQLDEGEALPSGEADWYLLAKKELELLTPLAGEQGVTLALTGESVPVRGSEQLLCEILHNLCGNAVKYNVPGGSVTVSLRTEGEEAVLTVSDTGIGIPREHQARIFERFYRVDRSRSKETGGTGLGLSIVKHAVRYMGGSVTLESEPGRGTEVTVRLPGGANPSVS